MSRDGSCWFESYESMPDGTVSLLGSPSSIVGGDVNAMTELHVPGVVNQLGSEYWTARIVTGFGSRSSTTDHAYDYGSTPSLKKIYIPRCITFIGYGAFAGCGTVTDVYYGGTSGQWSSAVGGRNIGLRGGAKIHYQSAEANDLGTCAYYPDYMQDTYASDQMLTSDEKWYFRLPSEEFCASEVVPRYKLMFGGERLKEGRDYSIACESNRLPGTALVKAVGAGGYYGASVSEFEIAPPTEDHLDARLSVAGASRVVETHLDGNGGIFKSIYWRLPDRSTPDAPRLSLLYDGKALREGEDYTIELLHSGPYNKEREAYYRANLTFWGDAFLHVRYGVRESASIGGFSDVTSGVAHHEDISWLAAQGISKGWDMPDGTIQFRPYANVARADMAAFLFRLAKSRGLVSEGWTPTGTAPFADVTAKTAHYREVMWLAESGISQGWTVRGGKEFRPYANVARADMAAFLRRLAQKAGVKEQSGGGASFRDVTAKTAHADDITWLAATGVSKGWDVAGGQKEFRPLANVTRADMAAFLHRLDGLK